MGEHRGYDAIPPDLVKAARGGSVEALGRIFEGLRGEFTQLACSEIAGDLQAKAGASDLVQQTFLEAFRDFGQFAGNSPDELRAWLRRILKHNVQNFARHFRNAEKRELGRELPLGAVARDALILHTPSPSGKAMNVETVAALEQALARLPTEYQQAIRLRHQERQSFAEIGAALDRSAEAARKLWVRALQQLKHELGDSQ